MIADSFFFEGEFYIVMKDGRVFRVIQGGPDPSDWTFVLASKLD